MERNLLVILHEQCVVKDCKRFAYFMDVDTYVTKEMFTNPFLEVHRYEMTSQLWYKASRWDASRVVVWEAVASTSVPKTVRMAPLISG